MDPQQQGAPPPITIDAVVQLLRDDEMRGFRIDIETDSMVESDQDAEKKNATEFVTAIGQFLTQLGPLVQVMPPLAPLVGGMLQFAVRRYKVGQELEDLIEKTMGHVSEMLGQPKPPQPSPDELVKLEGTKAKVQAEITKAQIGVEQAKVEAQTKMAQTQMDHHGMSMEGNRMQAEHQLQMEALHLEQEQEREQHAMKMEQMKQAAKQKSENQI
jgi:hypothetical protein